MATHLPYLGILLSLSPLFAQANLLVYPTRAVLSDKQKVINLALRNSGTKPETYKLSLIFFRQKPDGSLELVTNPDAKERSALKLLRFSPRKTTLTPNLEQTVRVMLAGNQPLPEGDYRAHINFEPTTGTEVESNEREAAGKEEIRIDLQAKISIAIPVIYRRGNPKFEVSLSKPKIVPLPDKQEGLSFNMVSAGNSFPYGDFFATFQSSDGGASKEVGVVRGIAGYIPTRNVSLPLNLPKGKKLSAGTLKIEFREADVKDGAVFASTELNVP